jgi:hypothetical protein
MTHTGRRLAFIGPMPPEGLTVGTCFLWISAFPYEPGSPIVPLSSRQLQDLLYRRAN